MAGLFNSLSISGEGTEFAERVQPAFTKYLTCGLGDSGEDAADVATFIMNWAVRKGKLTFFNVAIAIEEQ